jgi:probable HAF family extracellular repeat protein
MKSFQPVSRLRSQRQPLGACLHSFLNAAFPVTAVAIITLLMPAAARSAPARPWTLTDLGSLGGSQSFAYAINDRGQVVGESRVTGDGSSHAFLYCNGHMTDLYPLNSEELFTVGPMSVNNRGQVASGVMVSGVYYPAIYDSRSHALTILGCLSDANFWGFSGVATAVNNLGQAVGYSYVDSLNRHAFIFEDGAMTDLGSFGGYSAAVDINEAGVVVGFASDSVTGVAVATKWDNEGITAICGSRESQASGINDRGQIVGDVLEGGAFRAFVYNKGTVTRLGVLPTGLNSYGYNINNRGQVVGTADVISSIDRWWDPILGQFVYSTNYTYHGFLCDKGVMVDLNTLIPANSGWELNYATDINESGHIVGYGLLDGDFHGYLLTSGAPLFRVPPPRSRGRHLGRGPTPHTVRLYEQMPGRGPHRFNPHGSVRP